MMLFKSVRSTQTLVDLQTPTKEALPSCQNLTCELKMELLQSEAFCQQR